MAFVRRQQGVPCPICKHQSWCSVADNGEVVRCMRVESSKESVGSDGSIGWIHRLRESIPVERKERGAKPPLTPAEVLEIATNAYHHTKAKETRAALSESLGVSVKSLEALRVGFGVDHGGRVWSSWPSRDGGGNVIGISRRYENGEKKTLYRTKPGLFFPADRAGLRGPILILEGGSDVAAAYTVGLPAIGRPSNTGGAGWIKSLIGSKKAIVVGENDLDESRRGGITSCTTECKGCGHCWPGRFGAIMVAKQLGLPWVMPPRVVKDFRELTACDTPFWWELIRRCG